MYLQKWSAIIAHEWRLITARFAPTVRPNKHRMNDAWVANRSLSLNRHHFDGRSNTWTA